MVLGNMLRLKINLLRLPRYVFEVIISVVFIAYISIILFRYRPKDSSRISYSNSCFPKNISPVTVNFSFCYFNK